MTVVLGIDGCGGTHNHFVSVFDITIWSNMRRRIAFLGVLLRPRKLIQEARDGACWNLWFERLSKRHVDNSIPCVQPRCQSQWWSIPYTGEVPKKPEMFNHNDSNR